MLGSLTYVLWTVCRIALRAHRLCQTCHDLQTWLQWPRRSAKRPPNIENVSLFTWTPKPENLCLSTWTQSFLLFELPQLLTHRKWKEKNPQSWVFVVTNVNKREGDTEEGKRCLPMYHVEAITKSSHLQSANNSTENNLERAILLIQLEHTALIVSWRKQA